MRVLIDTTKVSEDKEFESDVDIEYFPEDEPKKLLIEVCDGLGSIVIDINIEGAIELRQQINDTVDMMVRGSVV